MENSMMITKKNLRKSQEKVFQVEGKASTIQGSGEEKSLACLKGKGVSLKSSAWGREYTVTTEVHTQVSDHRKPWKLRKKFALNYYDGRRVSFQSPHNKRSQTQKLKKKPIY